MAATEGDVSDDSTQQPMVGSDKSIGFRQARGMASPAIALRPCNSYSISAECFGADQWHPITGKRGQVACTGPKTRSTRCQDRIRFLSATFALGALLFTGAAGSSVVTCGNTQKVSVADGKSWRCQADLQANHVYLVQAKRQTRDVSLEIIGSDTRRILKVDSPTLRAGPELLYFSPSVTAKYTVVVAP